MGATLTGVPLYRRHGYRRQAEIQVPLPGGDSLPVVRMDKELAEPGPAPAPASIPAPGGGQPASGPRSLLNSLLGP
jgi:hypothetical protein